MTPPQPSLAQILRAIPRRYLVPAQPAGHASLAEASADPAATLAVVIEQARAASAAGVAEDAGLQPVFVEALAHLIRQALALEDGSDLAFQAMVLRHRAPRVREYASLASQAIQDGRQVRALVNAIAHPAKQSRTEAGLEREAMTALHAAMAEEQWPVLLSTVQGLADAVTTPASATPEQDAETAPFEIGLRRLLDDPALLRLVRLEALLSDDDVRQYRELWDRHGPRSGTPAAAAQGEASRRRGAAAEAEAAQALEALAHRLNALEANDATTGGQAPYRVVTAMHVPGALSANIEGAKTEWDAVLLRRSTEAGAETAVWDVCLLVEVKASADAATTDFPRLLRGLKLLTEANAETTYPFATRQGMVPLSGASLHALPVDDPHLDDWLLYCSDSPADPPSRPLGAASRMQLLTAPASLDYASDLTQGHPADPQQLAAVWQQLLDASRWQPILQQYATLRRVRELMVHVDDLAAAASSVGQ